MHEAVYSIFRVPIESVDGNSYLVLRGKEAAIVDTGVPGSAGQILEAIRNVGSPRVSAIILTHYHMDHTGSAAELKEATGAKVYVHEADAPFVSGRERPPFPSTVPRDVVERYSRMRHVEPDALLKDGDVVFGFRVVHVPGHTPGSIALYDGRSLFAGDNMNVREGSIQGSPAPYDWNNEMAKESLRKLLSLDFDVLLPGHGQPIVGEAAEAARRALLSR